MHGFGLKSKVIVFLFVFIIIFTVSGCGNGSDSSDGSGSGDNSMSVIVNGEADFSKKDSLEENQYYTSISKELFRVKTFDIYKHSQGSCSDGTYVYSIMRETADEGSVITKSRLSDGGFVARSEVIHLGHGNDMTYDSKNHRLVCAHGHSEGQILTLVDPDTLEFIEDVNIEAGSGAITYNAKRDIYAISQGGKSLHFLTSEFELIESLTRTDSFGYTAQGMGSDDNYIYFPMSSTDNILVVYDWDGNFVTKIHVPVNMESESMFWVNGKYYISYNSASMPICETEFIIGEKE